MMKYNRLILKGIKYYKRFSKEVLVLFIIGIISSTLLLIYLFGNINPIKVIFSEDDGKYNRRYDVDITNPSETKGIIDFFNDHHQPFEYICIGRGGIDIKHNLSDSEVGDRRYGVHCIAYGEESAGKTSTGRTVFTDEEIDDGAYVVIISESFAIWLRANINYGKDKLTIEGKEYTIIGKSQNLIDDLMIPSSTFERNGFETVDIIYYADAKPKYYNNFEFLRSFNDVFKNDAKINRHPYDHYDQVKGATPIMLSLMSIVYAVTAISFMFLLKFMADNTNYISVIYSICGASKEVVLYIKLLGVFFVTLASSLLGVIIHACTYKILFRKINIVENLIYSFSDYMQIIAVISLASVILSVPFAISFARNTVMINKNKFS